MKKQQFEIIDCGKRGRGVKALKRFRVGDTVMVITGQVITDPKYDSLTCMDIGWGRTLEPHEPGVLANHSCDGNCSLEVHSDTEACLVALVNIEPGRELVYDYGWPAEVGIDNRCRCGSPKCRKYIVGAGKEHQRLLRMLKRREAAKETKKPRKRG